MSSNAFFLSSSSPIVGLTMCRRPGHECRPDLDDFVVGEKYVNACVAAAGALPWPLVLPPDASTADTLAQAVVPHLSGLILTGSISNVAPQRYGQPQTQAHLPLEPRRDALTWALLDRALDMGMPILGICRGFQELNAYFGGTLMPRCHEICGYQDHRATPAAQTIGTAKALYGPNHHVYLSAQGRLQDILGQTAADGTITVNSLHWQGVETLAPDLYAEARAPDGLVEAFSHPTAKSWILGVQWHPEADSMHTSHYNAIFQAFSQACRHFDKR